MIYFRSTVFWGEINGNGTKSEIQIYDDSSSFGGMGKGYALN